MDTDNANIRVYLTDYTCICGGTMLKHFDRAPNGMIRRVLIECRSASCPQFGRKAETTPEFPNVQPE